ncbi:MAG: hypothetical protein NW224_27615 [Leptolyngbyaceae cyanobacterium bins.302]|nr:hypothetical protein [Leptolyngbyaceae cyanobacterium bins.302]
MSEFVGTFIAVLTLTLPVAIVARYSSAPEGTTIAPQPPQPSIIVRQMNSNTKGR